MRSAATRAEATDQNLEEIELKLLLEAVSMRYGYDFRDYAVGPLRRSIASGMAGEGVSTISAYQDRLLHERGSLQRFLTSVGVSVTSMFREPATWRCLREEVAPRLRTYPSVRVWSVGCSTGEEAYSLAILLEEEGIADVQIYATDLNQQPLEHARRGSYTLGQMRDYEGNYLEAGGRRSLADYYIVSGNHARIRPSVQRRVTWAQHNLVTDGSFNEFHLIVCINVLIYFRPTLQQRAHRLFYDSLVRSGYLALGQQENLMFCPEASRYQMLVNAHSVYKKVQ